MKFSYNWIRSLSDPNIPMPEEISKTMTMKLFEVEEIKKKGDDWILDINILPDRAGDCFSHIGIAREISAAIGFEFKEPEVKLTEDADKEISDLISIQVDDPIDCPRYLARVVTEVKVGPSPEWIKEKLQVCGIQSINNIVDIVNYVMLETGQPLHAFDMDRISGKIIVRKAITGERITTLDGKEIELNEKILVIADEKKLLGIAGIKGGKSAEISDTTENIVIESASFNRRVIRKGSAMIKLRTDASLRFEHGFDPNLSTLAADRTALMIVELAGGRIAKGKIDFYPEKVIPKTISLSLKRTERLLGIDVPRDEAERILSMLGFRIEKGEGDLLVIEVPTRRVDVLLQEDLIEEIGRIIGYDKTPLKLPKMDLVSPKRNTDLFFEKKIRELFKSVGFSEVYNHTFVSENQSIRIGCLPENLIEVESPVSIEQRYLRPSLIPHLLSNIKENLKFFDEIEIFELGKIFSLSAGEEKMISGALTGESFYQLKGVLELIFKEIGIVKIDYSAADSIYLDPSRSSKILANGIKLGDIGYLSMKIAEQIKIDPTLCLFELDFNKMIGLASEEKVYAPLIKYPEITRDLSIITPLKTPFKDVVNTINGCKIPLLRDVELFDLYQGKGVSQGNKSIALRLTFGEERTLTAEEVNRSMDDIIKEIEKNQEWQVRK